MGRLTIFQVSVTNNPQAVCMAGQPLHGYVTVELDEPMDIHGVKVYLKGEAEVKWTESRQKTASSTDDDDDNESTTVQVTYKADEKYVDLKTYIFGAKKADFRLEAGRQTIPFEFMIPGDIPSSFEGEHGKVRYELKAKIKRSSSWKSDPKTKRILTVISILDLNAQPDILSPQEGQDEKTLCCLCCASGPIVAQIRLDRRGYVPGESILITGEVNNGSNREMDSSKVKLIMKTQFHGSCSGDGDKHDIPEYDWKKTKTTSSTICELKKGSIEGGDTEAWTGERLHIPPLPPSELIYCKIIDIKYYVVMIVDPSGTPFDLEVPLDVMIGTVPLRNVAPMWYPPPQAPPFTAPDPENAIVDQPVPMTPYPPADPSAPPYPDAPPFYSECGFGKVTIKDDEENAEFTQDPYEWAPRYTYYDWSRPPPADSQNVNVNVQ